MSTQPLSARPPGPSNFIRAMGFIVIVLSLLGAIVLFGEAVSSEEICNVDSISGETVCVPGLGAFGISTAIAIGVYGSIVGAFMIVFAAMAENVAVLTQELTVGETSSFRGRGGGLTGARAHLDHASSRECPFCKESIRRDASVCPHCQRESAAWRLHEGSWWARDKDNNWVYLDEKRNVWVPGDESK